MYVVREYNRPLYWKFLIRRFDPLGSKFQEIEPTDVEGRLYLERSFLPILIPIPTSGPGNARGDLLYQNVLYTPMPTLRYLKLQIVFHVKKGTNQQGCCLPHEFSDNLFLSPLHYLSSNNVNSPEIFKSRIWRWDRI